MPDKDPAEEAEEILNESDEGVSDLLDDTEAYDESDDEADDYQEEFDDPQELDFEDGNEVPSDDE